ncbi:MAG: MBL fold metallo-hydrolase [Anaerolineae bacterium]|nr:MBL fold metallo-hydrolase [Anaerolineae bacterium]
MSNFVQSLTVGEAHVTVINIAYADWNFPAGLDTAASPWWPPYAAQFEQPVWSHHNVVHIALADASILVDAGFDDLPDSPYQLPRFRRNVDLSAALREVGVAPEDITHVVITHPHDDHIGGLTVKQGTSYTPRFPQARVLLSRWDWEGNPDREDPTEVCAWTLNVVDRAGRLNLVDGSQEVAPGVTILPAPGETPGHQIVRVQSEGQTAYVLGDLFHHPVMVEQPWVNRGRDVEQVLASRQRLAEAALAEDALLVAYHIGTLGKLRPTATGFTWEPVRPIESLTLLNQEGEVMV